jgi:hypothetical protein
MSLHCARLGRNEIALETSGAHNFVRSWKADERRKWLLQIWVAIAADGLQGAKHLRPFLRQSKRAQHAVPLREKP